MASDAPTVATSMTDHDAPPEVDGTLFKDICFFILVRVPSRSIWCDHVTRNGGKVVKLEKLADIIIADHARKDSPFGSISWTWIEACIREGMLVDKDTHKATKSNPEAQKRFRPAGAIVPSTRVGARTRFTREDDEFCWNFVQRKIKEGYAELGNRLYQELEAVRPNHPWQSWLDRYKKYICNNPPKTNSETTTHDPPLASAVSSKTVDKINTPVASADQIATAASVSGSIKQECRDRLRSRVAPEETMSAQEPAARTPSASPRSAAIHKELARRSDANPDLKKLMKRVAQNQASKEEIESFDVHIDDVAANVVVPGRSAVSGSMPSPRRNLRKSRSGDTSDAGQIKSESHASTAQAVLLSSPNKRQDSMVRHAGSSRVQDLGPERELLQADAVQEVSDDPSQTGENNYSDAQSDQSHAALARAQTARRSVSEPRPDQPTQTPTTSLVDSGNEKEVHHLPNGGVYVRCGQEKHTFDGRTIFYLAWNGRELLERLTQSDQEEVWNWFVNTYSLHHSHTPSSRLWQTLFDEVCPDVMKEIGSVLAMTGEFTEAEHVSSRSPEGFSASQRSNLQRRHRLGAFEQGQVHESSPLAGKGTPHHNGEGGPKRSSAQVDGPAPDNERTPSRKRARFAEAPESVELRTPTSQNVATAQPRSAVQSNAKSDRQSSPKRSQRGRGKFMISRSNRGQVDDSDDVEYKYHSANLRHDEKESDMATEHAELPQNSISRENEITIWQGEQFNVEEQENAPGSPDRHERRSGQPEQRIAVFTDKPDVAFKLEPTTIDQEEDEEVSDQEQWPINGHAQHVPDQADGTVSRTLHGIQNDGSAGQTNSQSKFSQGETQYQDAESQPSSSQDSNITSGQREETQYHDAPSFQPEAIQDNDDEPQATTGQLSGRNLKELKWSNGMLAELDTQALLNEYDTPPPELFVMDPSPIRNSARRQRNARPRADSEPRSPSPEPEAVFEEVATPPESPLFVRSSPMPTPRDRTPIQNGPDSSPDTFDPPVTQISPSPEPLNGALLEPKHNSRDASRSLSPELPVIDQMEYSDRPSMLPEVSVEDLDRFVQDQVNEGRTEDEVNMVLDATMEDMKLARSVLCKMAIGGELPEDTSGCWTPRDDEHLLRGDKQAYDELVHYHSLHSVNKRKAWLNQG